MMRLFILLATISICLSACNNDLKTIGQDLINNGNFIGEQNLQIESISTIKTDSFVTSSGLYASSYISKLVMGRSKDGYSGLTTAIPCFQVAPTYKPSVSTTASLDSVTLQFSYAGNIWGDTLYDIKIQSFDLYQLNGLPELDYDDNGYFYNTSPVALGDKIASCRFLPKIENMKLAYFKISQEVGNDLFERMKYPGGDDDIYNVSASGDVQFLNFLRYFKGLAIVPENTNDCLMTINAISDSLYLRFDYHENNSVRSLKFPIAQREYQYNAITTEPSERFKTLTNQEKSVSFNAAGIAVAQGLSGYMVKLTLPQPPLYNPYTTIIKAEIEIKPEIFTDNPIPFPSQINVYTTNDVNEITGYLQNNSSATVIGRFQQNTPNTQDARYLFDITEYYQRLSASPPLIKDPQILLSVPNLTLSFDRMVVRAEPIVRIYYANYK